jgi:hypothetical protein
MTMTHARTLVTVTLAIAIATAGAIGCSGGVQGTYSLDSRDLSIAGAMARAAGPEASKGGDAIKTSLEILGGGKTKLKDTIPEALAPIVNGETLNTQEKTGTWKLAGDSVMLTWDDDDQTKRALIIRNAMPDTCAKSPGKLTCTSSKQGSVTWVFVKK